MCCFGGRRRVLRSKTIVSSRCRPSDSLAFFVEFSFETNAPPVGGYVTSDMMRITGGQDAVTLQTLDWTDDFDDLPMAYEFGFTQGWREVLLVSR